MYIKIWRFIMNLELEKENPELPYCPRWRSEACPDSCPGKHGICCYI